MAYALFDRNPNLYFWLLPLLFFNISMLSYAYTPIVSFEYNILDLYGDLTYMALQASLWTINGQPNTVLNEISSCNGLAILGALIGSTNSKSLERTYTTAAEHDIIYYSIRVFAINGWQSGDTITFHLDGTLIVTWEPVTYLALEGYPYCGDSISDDMSVFFAGKFYHTASTLTLKLTAHITSGLTNAAFGIRANRMSLTHRKATDSQGMCVKYSYTINPPNCPCQSGSAEDPSNPGQCVPCPAGAVECFGPGMDQIYGCVTGYSYDGTKCVPCPSGCQLCLGSNVNVCLQCAPAKILAWNNTCITSCDYYLRKEGNYQFCDVCQPGYSQYPNGTCLPGCTAPWKERILVESSFCDYPCGDASIYFHTKDSTCSSKCEYPYVVQNDVLCVINLAEAEVKQAQAVSGGLNVAGKITGAASAIAGALSSGDPGAFCLATLSEMLHYIRYMKIKYPPKLQLILDQDKAALFDIVPEMTPQMIDAFPQNRLPEKFEQYQLPSSFIVNFWEPGITLAGLVIFGVFAVSGLEIIFLKLRPVRKLFGEIRQTVKWNFCIMVFISNLEDIVLSSSFELRTETFNSFLSVLSFLACIMVNMIAFCIFAKMVAVIWTLQKAKITGSSYTRPKRLEIAKHKLKNFQILFEECKEGNLFQQAYMCIFVLKVYLFYFVIAYLFDYPRVQTVLITVLSLAMVLYLVFLRPLKSRLNLVQNVIQEVIILIVNICTMILSFLDMVDAEATESRRMLGEVLIGCDLAFSAFGVLCLFINLGITFYGVIQMIKRWYARKKLAKNQKIADSSDINLHKPSLFRTKTKLGNKQKSSVVKKIMPAENSMAVELVSPVKPSNGVSILQNKTFQEDLNASLHTSVSYLLNNSFKKSKALTSKGLSIDDSVFLNHDLTRKDLFGGQKESVRNEGSKLSAISGLFSYRYVISPSPGVLKESEKSAIEGTEASNQSIFARRSKGGSLS